MSGNAFPISFPISKAYQKFTEIPQKYPGIFCREFSAEIFNGNFLVPVFENPNIKIRKSEFVLPDLAKGKKIVYDIFYEIFPHQYGISPVRISDTGYSGKSNRMPVYRHDRIRSTESKTHHTTQGGIERWADISVTL